MPIAVNESRRKFLITTALLAAHKILPKSVLGNTTSTNSNNWQDDPPVYGVSKVITGSRIPNEYQAYYKVDHPNSGWFYVALRKETKNQKISAATYDPNDKSNGRLFQEPYDTSKPVASVDVTSVGIKGKFNIYDNGSAYTTSFPISPLLSIPSHTEVKTDYLLTIDRALKDLPSGVVSALSRNGTELMITKNVRDSYYWLYPSWKTYDDNATVDPNRPWIEKINGRWVDNRLHRNVPGYYMSDRNLIMMPQEYIRYGTKDEIIDRTTQVANNRSTVFHEIGHGIDYLPSTRYSDRTGFIENYNDDMTNIPEEEQERVGYFLMNRREPFAEITGALLGGLTRDRAARILSYFPSASEHIRTDVLPRYGYEISIDYVRENIYEDYLKEKDAEKSSQVAYRNMLQNDAILCC